MSKMKNQSLEPSTEAAALRASMELGIPVKKAIKYCKLLYDTFKIKGPDDYQKLRELLLNNCTHDYIFETILDYDSCDSEELFCFLIHLLGGTLEKKSNDTQLEKIDLGQFLDEIFRSESTDKNLAKHKSDGKEGGWVSMEAEVEEDKLQILNYEIKTLILDNDEAVKYIEAVEKRFEVLEKDFEKAEHFGVISEIARDENGAYNHLLICESKETGLLACKYLASVISRDISILEHDLDFYNKLPVIQATEIDRYFNENITFNSLDPMPESFGLQSVMNLQKPPDPWWVINQNLSLVILIERKDYLTREFPEKIKRLGDIHSRIIIIFEKERKETNDKSNAFVYLKGSLTEIVENISFKLCYDTYSISDPKINSEYMKMVVREAAKCKGYRIGDDVLIEDVLEQLKFNRGSYWEGNTTIVQFINKVISMKKKGVSNVLNEEDFAFSVKGLSIINGAIDFKETIITKSAVLRMNEQIAGLDSVKNAIMEAVNVLKVNRVREKYGLKSCGINNVFVFYGPPGVGKTEMANHFTEIMFENELLSGKNFISISGAELKAPFVGQAAARVVGIFEKHDAIFLDEIYTLTAENSGKMDSFSQEALGQLCIEMEKHSKNKLIIFAGYGGAVKEENNKMKQFLNANPGIRSRVTFHIDFPNYSADIEIPQIFEKIANNNDYLLEEGWREMIIGYFTIRSKGEDYGNAREARKLFQQAVSSQATRISDNTIDVEELRLIRCEDIRLSIDKILEAQRKIDGREASRIGF